MTFSLPSTSCLLKLPNVFCETVSIRIRAWHRVVGPRAVTSAVCMSVLVCDIVLVKVVSVGVTILLLCGSSCFSCCLLESRLGSRGSQIIIIINSLLTLLAVKNELKSVGYN